MRQICWQIILSFSEYMEKCAVCKFCQAEGFCFDKCIIHGSPKVSFPVKKPTYSKYWSQLNFIATVLYVCLPLGICPLFFYLLDMISGLTFHCIQKLVPQNDYLLDCHGPVDSRFTPSFLATHAKHSVCRFSTHLALQNTKTLHTTVNNQSSFWYSPHTCWT